jgi:hypothetical protein
MMAVAAIGGCAVIAVSAAAVVVGTVAGVTCVVSVAAGTATAAEATAAVAPFVQAGVAFGWLDLTYNAIDKGVKTYQEVGDSGLWDGFVVLVQSVTEVGASKLFENYAKTESMIDHVKDLLRMGAEIDKAVLNGSQALFSNAKFREICKRYMQKSAHVPAKEAARRGVLSAVGTLLCADIDMMEKLEKLEKGWDK